MRRTALTTLLVSLTLAVLPASSAASTTPGAPTFPQPGAYHGVTSLGFNAGPDSGGVPVSFHLDSDYYVRELNWGGTVQFHKSHNRISFTHHNLQQLGASGATIHIRWTSSHQVEGSFNYAGLPGISLGAWIPFTAHRAG